MKKIYSFIGAFLLASIAFSQMQMTFNSKRKILDLNPNPVMVIDHSAQDLLLKATTVFSEDFSTGLAAWTLVDNAAGGGDWSYFDGTGGELSSATATNGYAGFDSDAFGTDGFPENADLISPSFSCVGLASVGLEFTHYFRDGYGGAGEVSVSSDDGLTWTSVQTWGPASSANGAVEFLDVSALLTGQATCKIKFNWQGDWSWWWFVDDIVVADLPSDEVAMNYGVSDIVYPVLPLSQVQPVTIQSEIQNLGSTDFTNLSIDFDLNNGAYTDAITVASLLSGATDISTLPNPYTPAAEGFYEGGISLSNVGLDVDLTNNYDSIEFFVTDTAQLSNYGYDNIYNFGDSIEFAQSFDVYVQDTITSISFGHWFDKQIDENLNDGVDSLAFGQTINYAIYSDVGGLPGTEIVATSSYTLMASDTGFDNLGYITLGIDNGIVLLPGKYWAYFHAPIGTGSSVLVDQSFDRGANTLMRDLVGGFGGGFTDWYEPAGFGLPGFTHAVQVNYGHLPPPCNLAVTASGTNATTNGGSDGVASATVTGGQGTISYAWTPSGGTAATATGLSADTYTVTVTDDVVANCTATAEVTIGEPAAATCDVSVTASGIDATTNGGSDGVASATVTGGQGTISYAWTPSGGTAATATGLAADTYTVTVTDDVVANCTATAEVTIGEPGGATCTLEVTASGIDASTNGGSDGVASATVTGGQGTISYAWTPSGGTGATATGLSADTYTVTVTDDVVANCTATAIVTIGEPALTCDIAVTATGTDATTNGGSDGVASATVTGGQGAISYAWTPSGGTAATATGLAADVYTVTVTDDVVANCTATVSVVIGEPQPAGCTVAVDATGTDATTNGGSDGSAEATVTGGQGTISYAWTPSGGTASTATGLSADTYTVTVTDDVVANCTATAIVTIGEPAACNIAVTASGIDATTNGGSDGVASATVTGGQGAISYAWTPSGGTAATATGLSADTYTVTVTDDVVANCSATATVIIGQPVGSTCNLAVSASGTDATTNGGSDGVASATVTGGQGTISYAWTPSGGTAATATGLSADTYTVTVTDDVVANCTATAEVTIGEPASATCDVAVTASGIDATTNGGSDGVASATVTGGQGTISYAWTPSGGTAATATGLSADTYTVTVTDDVVANCTATAEVTIGEPAACNIAVSATGTDATTNGGSDGSAEATVTGGQGTISYAWAPAGGSAATATGLAAGTYTVTVTDDIVDGCIATATVIIGEPAGATCTLEVTVVGTNVTTAGGSNGTASATVTGGQGAISYAWAPAGGSAATATGLAAGTYTVTVTDDIVANCVVTASVLIEQPSAIIDYVDNNSFVISPNPNNGAFRIEMSNTVGIESIIIRNLLGQVVYSKSVNSSIEMVELGNVTSGVYFITAGNLTKRVIVKK